MNKLRILTGLILAMTLMPLQAHHSTAMFDDQREITVTGTIKEFQYTNPHSWLIIDVTNDDGSVTTWGFEAEGPTTLTRSGIRKSTLPPGTKITITGHPMKDGRSAAAWVVAELEDGTVLNPRAGFVAR
ncbi:DUF6152 family protein [Gammaproteobacteria bacterium]|jgi:DNA/RNA endonuclease YhcR with UshA esterase domain|nr:DUF6152 family protein [Gammaproteobacteria bacterium]